MHELSFITFFLLPSGILLYLYISMGVTLRGSIRKNSSLTNNHLTVNGGATTASYYHAGSGTSVRGGGDSHIHNSRKQIIRMLGQLKLLEKLLLLLLLL